MSFSQQEEELLDVLRERQQLTGLELSRLLRWSTARLHPILAALQEKGAVSSHTDQTYPMTTYYRVAGEPLQPADH